MVSRASIAEISPSKNNKVNIPTQKLIGGRGLLKVRPTAVIKNTTTSTINLWWLYGVIPAGISDKYAKAKIDANKKKGSKPPPYCKSQN